LGLKASVAQLVEPLIC